MPITMQKRRSHKQSTKTITVSNEKKYLVSKLLNSIPTALILLFFIFLWSSSSTFISGSIFHVCVTSRKLNNHVYCLSAGAQPTNLDIPQPIANTNAPPTVPISSSFRTHLSSVSTSVKESISVTKHVEAPSTLAIQLPSSRGSETKEIVDDEAHGPLPTIIQLPVANNNTEHFSSIVVVQSPITKHISQEAKDLKNNTKPIVSLPTESKTKVEDKVELAKKDVEEQMEVLRSYKIGKLVNYNNQEACDGRGIFVYNLPSKFNKDLLGHCTEMITWMDFCKFLSNNAFGEPVHQLGDGWYNTHQYALEPIFHARILKHPCRVHNPEEAKVFYVPYYGGLDILRWHFKKNITIQMKDRLSYELIEWLNEQAPWKKNFGIDHVFVLGKISWDFRRMKNFTWGTHFLDMDEMQSPMKLLIERHPWHINDIGVPHPSFFHPRSDNDIFAWQRKLMQMPRRNLVSFAGAPRPNARESIRSILIEQCQSSPDKCKFFDCRGGRCTQPAPMVELFMGSEFCLQPIGDSATRKSVFDSLLAGCIPVLFSPFTAYYQYPWHLPVDRSNYSVFVDQEEVRRQQVNVVDRLVAIPATRRAEMRRRIVYELLPGLVYADPEGKLEKFEDAFTLAMNSVLERMSKLP